MGKNRKFQSEAWTLLILINSIEIPPDKPPPLKYHLYTKKDSQKPGDNQQDMYESEDDDEQTELDTTLEEKQHLYYQQQQSSILLTTECFVVSPGAAIPGSLAVTSDSIYFTADEESEEMKKLDQQVCGGVNLSCLSRVTFWCTLLYQGLLYL